MIRLFNIRSLKSGLKALFLSFVSLSTLALGEPFFGLLGMRRGAAALPKLTEYQRILVLRFDQIGDVVMTIPLLRELKRNAPQAQITLVVKPEIKDLVSACPYVDEVLTFDWHIPKRSLEYRRRLLALKFCFTHLWRRRFDLAIIPRWDADWYSQTFLAYASGARRRIGYSEDVDPIKQVHNHGYDRLMTQTLHRRAVTHEVERSLDILREMGGTVTVFGLELWTTASEDDWAQDWLQENQITEDQPLFALGPFAGNSTLKKWPMQNFAALGRWLRDISGGRILIVGGLGNEKEAQRLCAEIGAGAFTQAGQCSLPQTVALLKRCALYLGDDSGPMHLASAVGIPVIALFGPSCPHRFGPWTPKKQVLWKQLPCSPCSVENDATEKPRRLLHCLPLPGAIVYPKHYGRRGKNGGRKDCRKD